MTPLLVMFYVDCGTPKGDACRARRIVRALGVRHSLTFVAINCADIARDIPNVRCFSIPRLRHGGALLWNIASLLIGLYSVLRYGPKLVYADVAPGSVSPALVSWLARVPLFVELHCPVGGEDIALYRSCTRFKVRLALLFERMMLETAVLVGGARGWLNLARDVYHLPIEKTIELPLGVDRALFASMDRAACRNSLGLPDVPIALFVGNVAPWQGLRTVIGAWANVLEGDPAALCLIVGDGDERSALQRLAIERGLSRAVRLIGGVPHERVALYIGAANVCLSMFPGNRGRIGGVSAMKTLEYLSCGRPVIVSLADEWALRIEAAGAGTAVIPDDGEALALAINRVLQKNVNDHACRAAREIARELPSWDSVFDTLSVRLNGRFQ